MKDFLIVIGIFLLCYWPNASAAERRAIAIIDTGIGFVPELLQYECVAKSQDFTGTDLQDRIGHGTAITRLVTDGLDPNKFCFFMIKWLDHDGQPDAAQNVVRSINYAIDAGANIINMSLGGTAWSPTEEEAVERALASHIHVVVAAGNSGFDLSRTCPYYPACYRFRSPYFHVVASYDGDVRERWSNFGPQVTDRACGVFGDVRGTSISTAKITNRIAKRLQ